ncbi:PhzF family phenazine biosynthesis protein [Nonomuraea sp. WAC 01424]|uniref:PhzF family phenazine biosynthesis protein n=1 Tax=Nonomuraea sp. WAC 01424 TaxID=2203200 RepID=UPI000F7B5494|nr:PhzF family phenazine biosynthesis protein [Nonomuraea sp. WAC 01424]RSN04952.1 PhzF family phenazine biosynthesis protein [Nonomuraea sp. WAC 01424]
MSDLAVIVRACVRDGVGGSPTAVLADGPFTEDERRAVPVGCGTSHAVFVSGDGDGPVTLRFFTSEGELPACGHGTVAALAVLAARTTPDHRLAPHAGDAERRFVLRAGGRVFGGRVVRRGEGFEGVFDPGPVAVRETTAAERDLIRPLFPALAGPPVVASVGRPRLLVPVAGRVELAALTPDLDRLRAACDRLGLLGCYVHTVPTADGRVAARMFAPSIGVPEDVANANSTACLAAHLAGRGLTALTVDMGDSLSRPATITATAEGGPQGVSVAVGGLALLGPN